jgi:hypothetical protein
MVDETVASVSQANADAEFIDKATRALRSLYERAKAAHELHFVMALMPELRGMQDAGWSTAHDAVRAYDDCASLLNMLNPTNSATIRVGMAFYAHVAEGSGFYEVPKKLMLTIQGNGNVLMPFDRLVDRHRLTGERIAPNANRIMKDLIGHASELGLSELAEVFRDAFDPDVRSAIAHADYIIWRDELRLRRRNGGQVRTIPWKEFFPLMQRGYSLFACIRQLIGEYGASYDPPKTIRSRLTDDEPETDYTLYSDPKTGVLGFTTGQYPR